MPSQRTRAGRRAFSVESSAPEPVGRWFVTIEPRLAEVVSAMAFSGGCRWVRVGTASDALRWIRLR